VSLVRNILRAAAALLALLAYVWYAGVRVLPHVKRRKAARRRRPHV
jgi:hypothetical protein